MQHLELCREIARQVERRFSPGRRSFPSRRRSSHSAKRIVGLDGQAKMSKSLGNTIGVTESPAQIWEKLRPAMTDPARKTRKDPGTPEICNLYALHRHFSPAATVRRWPKSVAPRAGAASSASGSSPTR